MSNKNLLNESQVRQFMKLARLEPLTQGFVEGLNEAEESEELEERRRSRSGKTDTSHGRSQGEHDDGTLDETAVTMDEDTAEVEEGMGMYRDDEDDIEDAEHDMDHADDLEMDAEEDMADVGDDDRGGMIAVDDFLSALESALESVLGDEVEIDSDEMDADEDEDEMDVEVGAVDDVEDDVEDDIMQEGDDEELEEGTKKGNIKKDDRKKKGHHGRGPKRRETAKEEDELAYEKNESAEATDELVEQITKRVAARILKSALAKK